MKLYAAYGSNLNIMQMGVRCPSAKIVGIGIIDGYKLAFNKYLTIRKQENSIVPVGVWKINEEDEERLDRYEGYPTLYWKETIKVVMENGKEIEAMVYIMNEELNNKYCTDPTPIRSYVQGVLQGYTDAGLDTKYLEQAIKECSRN